jgi:23S rRNA (cytosine1962-C5)-methyltransferase
MFLRRTCRSSSCGNGFDATRHEAVDADVNAYLRAALEQGRRFDAIVLDPPKFAHTAAQAERAARAYKDINRLGLRLLRPGGLLFTFSCSGGTKSKDPVCITPGVAGKRAKTESGV